MDISNDVPHVERDERVALGDTLGAQRLTRIMMAAAIGVVPAACAGNTGDSPDARTVGESVPDRSTTMPDLAPVDVAPTLATLPPPTVPTPTTTRPRTEVTSFSPVSAALTEAPRVDGWHLEPGDWMSTAFDPALGFRTTVPLRLIDQSPAAIRLALPGTNERARITILTPLAVGSDDGLAVAVSNDFEQYVRDLDSIDLVTVESGLTESGTDLVWADFSARRAPGLEPYPCDLGEECIWIMRSEAGPDLTVIEHDPIRIAATTLDGLPLRVVASADPAQFDEAAAAATAIARSLVLLPDATPAPSRRTLLAAVGRRADAIPAGDHVARVGNALVELSLDRPLDDTVIDFSEANALAFELTGLGNVSLVQPTGFIDPDWPQTIDEPTPQDFVTIHDLDTYLDWHRAIHPGATTTPATLAGAHGIEVTNPFDDDVDHFACPPDWFGPDVARCRYTLKAATGTVSGDRWIEYDGGGTVRLVVLADPFLMVFLAPTDDDVAAAFATAVQPLVDAMRITKIGG